MHLAPTALEVNPFLFHFYLLILVKQWSGLDLYLDEGVAAVAAHAGEGVEDSLLCLLQWAGQGFGLNRYRMSATGIGYERGAHDLVGLHSVVY